jgi:Ca2+-binding RTX toxin-like protein
MLPKLRLASVLAILPLAASLLITTPVSAAPTVWQYPSTICPVIGDHGLQDCVDGAQPGDTIELIAEVIDEGVDIDKSLTLRPDDPSLNPSLTAISLSDSAEPDVTIAISDLRAAFGINGTFQSGTGDQITITHVTAGMGLPVAEGIALTAFSPVRLTVLRSVARTTQPQTASLQLYADYPGGGVSTLTAIANRITQTGATGAGSGIEINAYTDVTFHATIKNNLITHVVEDAAGGASGIQAYVADASHATLSLVGNTADDVGSTGIYVGNDVTAAGHVTASIFNNILSHTHGSALAVSTPPGGTTLHAGYNDFFANGAPNELDGLSAGTGNLTVPPEFQNRGKNNYHLKAGSLLIDAGLTCQPGGEANPDVGGNARWAGASVDIGAFESNADSTFGKVYMGTDGPDLLTGGSSRDIICGMGGADSLSGRGGPDFIDGGRGRDHLTGGTGSDRLYGQAGNDRLCARDGIHGNDYLDGGDGTDSAQRDSGDVVNSVEGSITC